MQLVAKLLQKQKSCFCGWLHILLQILISCFYNSPQNLLQKHCFLYLRLVAKTLSYNSYFLRAVAGVRTVAPRGGRELRPHP
jgi:hypothetical protein